MKDFSTIEAKVCSKCQTSKPIGEFRRDYRRPNGRRHSRCAKCSDSASGAVQTKLRRSGKQQARFWRQDSRKWDKNHGFVPDETLTEAVINVLLLDKCVYCGDDHTSGTRMTLDRVNNAVGHSKDNLVTSCSRCNFMRRDMPIEAWLHISGAVKSARELGLFGTWTGEIHKKK